MIPYFFLVILLLALVFVIVYSYFLKKEKHLLYNEKQQLNETIIQKEKECSSLQNQLTQLNIQVASLQTEKKVLQENWTEERKRADDRKDKEFQERTNELSKLKEELILVAKHIGNEQRDKLRETNRVEIDAILKPLTQSVEQFKEKFLLTDTQTKEQVKNLMEQTFRLSKEANELTEALRYNSKTQGNWGEAVLQNILETSGLTRGRDYDIQVNVKDEDGKQYYPDVVIYLPGNKSVIIDSKVSLKAFIAYTSSNTEEERNAFLQQHIDSVERHIKALSEKDYPAIVPGAIGYVLMFIPNESAYLAAVQNHKTLLTEAYGKQVILLNPSNLFMTLQLVYNLWQTELQSKNVKDIYESAGKLHQKFITFTNSFEAIGIAVGQLQKKYDLALGQLAKGRGNIIKQFEKWEKKGLNVKNKPSNFFLQYTDNDEEEEESLLENISEESNV